MNAKRHGLARKQKSYFLHFVTYFFNELAIAKNKYLITVDYCRQSKDVKVTMEVQLAIILGYDDTLTGQPTGGIIEKFHFQQVKSIPGKRFRQTKNFCLP